MQSRLAHRLGAPAMQSRLAHRLGVGSVCARLAPGGGIAETILFRPAGPSMYRPSGRCWVHSVTFGRFGAHQWSQGEPTPCRTFRLATNLPSSGGTITARWDEWDVEGTTARSARCLCTAPHRPTGTRLETLHSRPPLTYSAPEKRSPSHFYIPLFNLQHTRFFKT